MTKRPFSGLTVFMTLAITASACAAQAAGSTYHRSKTISLEGDGSWDYLISDSKARRLYVTHSDSIAVLNIDSGESLGAVRGLNGVHGVAIVPDTGHGFASNGKADTIAMFDLNTLEVTAQFPSGDNPDAIIYDPASRQVFAFNHSGGDVTVINPADGSAAGTIEIGGELEYAVADGEGSIFVNVEDRSEIVRIDSTTLEAVSRWPLGPCEEPTGLAMDLQSHRLFGSCGNGILIVVDAANGKIIAQVPIGQGSDGVRFDPMTRLIFTSNGEGSLSIIHEDSDDSYPAVATVPTERGARTLEIDLTTHRIFTATAKFGPVPEVQNGERRRPPLMPGSFVVLEYAP